MSRAEMDGPVRGNSLPEIARACGVRRPLTAGASGGHDIARPRAYILPCNRVA